MSMTHELAANIVDSVREGAVLMIVGVLVYKMDHREAARRLASMTGVSRDAALTRIAETRLIPAEHMLDEAITDIAELAKKRMENTE